MKQQFASGSCRGETVGLKDITNHDLNVETIEATQIAFLTDQGSHLVAVGP